MRPTLKLGVVIVILTIISVAAGLYFQPKTTTYIEGFEEDLGGWEGDADVPPDPNNPGSPVDWKISRVTSPVKSGQYSVELYIDGRQDDGTVWIEKKLSVRKNTQIQVKVSFDVYRILDTKVTGDELKELVIQCNMCKSKIRLGGFNSP